MKEKSESEVAQSCPTLCNPMDCSPPGSSAHGIFQAWVLEWGATAFSIVPLPGFKPVPPAVEAWSLNYWIVRELPTNIYHISFVCQESGHSLAGCFWLRGSQSPHLKFQLRENLIPRTFMLLLPGFSSSWAVDWGPQFLHACWLEASLSFLPYGPLYRAVRFPERKRERKKERKN